jgi:hypothetical protein
MRDQTTVLQELIKITKQNEAGLINSQEMYDSYQPLLIELTHFMYLSNIKTEKFQTELREMQEEAKQNVDSTQDILNEMQSYDMTVRASYNFIFDKGYQEEFMNYFTNSLDDAAAKIRRSEFELIKLN